MTDYLQKFVPRLSEITTLRYELTKSYNVLQWDEQVHGAALEETRSFYHSSPKIL